MKMKRLFIFFVSAVILSLSVTPTSIQAASITLTVPTDYATIQNAIDAAVTLAADNPGNTYSVLVEPGTYPGTITLHNNIPVRGRETARTFITGGNTGTAVTSSGASGISFRNFTIISATIGIDVSGNSSVSITNNVFNLGTGGTAIRIQGSPSAEVINNTFYQNGIAISRDSDIKVINNIFSNNTSNISQVGTVGESNISYNCFNPAPTTTEPKGSNYIPNTTYPVPNPLFVDPTPTARDFHLQEGSPCIDTGDPGKSDPALIPPDITNPSDIGAYGGSNADTIPYPVSIQSTDIPVPTSITVTWGPNNSYMVTNTDPARQGGYKVYYSLNATGAPYQSSVDNPGNVTNATLTGLDDTATAPSSAATLIKPVDFANQTLKLKWSSVTGATGYYIYYLDNDDTNIPPLGEQKKDVKNVTYYELGGLTNYHHYSIAVVAYAQNTYSIAVTAYDSTEQALTPGVQHESDYSAEEAVPLGTPAEGPKTYDPDTFFPEPITPYPELKNTGCFIATAAYEHYTAPQVRALRDFRDEYLLTNAPGRAFVRWYYTYGPIGAEFINKHPWLKPVVRAALLPAVGSAMFMTKTTGIEKVIVLSILMIISGYAICIRKKLVRAGGRQ